MESSKKQLKSSSRKVKGCFCERNLLQEKIKLLADRIERLERIQSRNLVTPKP